MDKIVFITGASSGIGAGCARKFASQGASLILNARNVNKLSALKEELEKQYGAKIYLTCATVKRQRLLWNHCPRNGNPLIYW
jgi:NADP-dependent 3-hydroxy acid dehydrogenase YdfG